MPSNDILPPYKRVGFWGAIKLAYTKAFTLKGRATRPEYWWFNLFGLVGLFLSTISDVLLSPYRDERFLEIIFLGLAAVPSITVAVRRLHDTNRNGWWAWVPIIGIIAGGMTGSYALYEIVQWSSAILIFVMLCFDGTVGPNRYGEDPKGRTADTA